MTLFTSMLVGLAIGTAVAVLVAARQAEDASSIMPEPPGPTGA